MKMYRPHRLCPRNSKPKEPSLYRSLCVSILCMFLSTVMLVGTTFAWFHSSATSAVSTITAGGLNVTTSYITQNTARAHLTEEPNSETNIDSLGWVPFSGNGGNPFGSIPFTGTNTSQIIFLKVENKSSLHTIYRLSLNLLGDVSADQSGNNLFFGYQVLKPTDDSPISTQSLCSFSIPSEENGIKPNDSHEAEATVTGADSSTSEKVTTAGIFYGDALSVHGISSTDSNTYGGNLCVVDLPENSTKYIAVALYMSGESSETTLSSFLIQLSMTVNQFGATDPLMPNKVEQSTSAALSAKPFTMSGVELEEETGKEEDTSEEVIPAEETPAETPTPTETPTGSTTETPTGSTTETPTGSTTETPTGSTTETPTGSTGEAGTSESGDTGDTGTPAAGSEPAPTPTT